MAQEGSRGYHIACGRQVKFHHQKSCKHKWSRNGSGYVLFPVGRNYIIRPKTVKHIRLPAIYSPSRTLELCVLLSLPVSLLPDALKHRCPGAGHTRPFFSASSPRRRRILTHKHARGSRFFSWRGETIYRLLLDSSLYLVCTILGRATTSN